MGMAVNASGPTDIRVKPAPRPVAPRPRAATNRRRNDERTRRRSVRGAAVGLAVLMAFVVGVPAMAKGARGRTCLPPFWGGILAGMSTDAEVTQLFGAGTFDPSLGEDGERRFVDSARTATLIVEYGTDQVVVSAEVKQGIPSGLGTDAIERMVAPRFDPDGGIGVWFDIHLGDTRDAVRKNLGAPASSRREGDQDVWTYQSTCACALEAGFTFRFTNGHLTSFAIWSEDG